MSHRVAVIGSGPAGMTAALYLSRANVAVDVYEGTQPGGQLTITTEVDNFPGFPHGIMGPELMDNMRAQCSRFGAKFEMDDVEALTPRDEGFDLQLAVAGTQRFDAVILATGATARYLGLPNEKRLGGYGVSACATCDGFFFKDVPIAVVGGGDSAMEEATFLTKFASEVHLLVRTDRLRASRIMQERAQKNPKIRFHWHTEVADVLGEDRVTGLRLRDPRDGSLRDLAVRGLFLAIGHTPNTSLVHGLLELDDAGYVRGEPDSSRTAVPGLFACGDVKDHVYRQAITAAGSGCMAALDCERWLTATKA